MIHNIPNKKYNKYTHIITWTIKKTINIKYVIFVNINKILHIMHLKPVYTIALYVYAIKNFKIMKYAVHVKKW